MAVSTAGSRSAAIGGVAAPEVKPESIWSDATLLLVICIWGMNFAVAKRALATFDPLAFNALRYAMASLLLYAVLRRRGRVQLPAREDWGRVLFLGILGNAVYQLVFIIGLDLTAAGSASLMLALMPVLVLLLDVRSGTRHEPRAWLGVAASIFGVAMVSRAALRVDGTEALVGNLLLIGAAAFFAIYTQGARPLLARYGSLRTTAWTLWTGAAVIFLTGVPSLFRQDWGGVDTVSWAGLFYSGLLSIGLAYLLWYRSVGRIGSSRTAIYSNLTPVVALIAGTVWLGEQLTPLTIVGAALVIGGVMLVRR